MDNNIDRLVKDTLTTVVKNTFKLFSTKKPETFIVFLLLGATENYSASDNVQATDYIYRATLYSKSDYADFIPLIKSALSGAGFYNIELGEEDYENDTKYASISIEFTYTQED